MGPPGPGGMGPGGPPPNQPDPKEMRRHCFRMIREITGDLGWKYKLWIPTAMILSSVFLLPQWYLQYFTVSTQRFADTPANVFVKWLVIYGAIIAATLWLALFLSGVLREWLRLTVSVRLRRDAVTSLSRTRIDQLDAGHRGDWMTRLTSDLRNCEQFLTESLTSQVREVTMLVGTLALFLYFSGPIALVLIPVALGLIAFNMVVQYRMGPTLGMARQVEGNVFQSMIETFEGLRTIRSFGAESFTMRRIGVLLDELFATGMRIIKSMSLLMGMNELGSQLVITAVLTLAAYRIHGGELTAAQALVYPFYINMFLGSANMLASSSYEWNRFFQEGGRLAMLLYDSSKQIEEEPAEIAELRTDLKSIEALSVKDLSVAYGDDPPVIDDFDFTLRSGEIIAIMGPSGCGKSTFLEVFSGLRQAGGGEFKIDLKNSEPRIADNAPVFLTAFVEQQPYLFVGSIRDNITMGMEGVSDDDIWRALDEVRLDEIIRFRGGLDEVLHDRGRNLSVGQQYRLALCRSLVCGRPFLFLDEPFAALDVVSIERVVETLHQERDAGAGIILVTHLLPETLQTTRVVEMTPQYHD